MNRQDSSQVSKPFIHFFVHSDSDEPIALRLDLKHLLKSLLIFSIFFLFFIIGTLLFFKELETNKKLHSKILELELNSNLLRYQSLAPSHVEEAKQKVEVSLTEKENPSPIGIPQISSQEGVNISARLSELNVECSLENCSVRISLMPTGAGIAAGHLLVILETEVPRIGSHTPTTQVRKKYFIYPGNIARDEIDINHLEEFEGKVFQFSKALQATAAFNLENLLKPLAVNIYLYDTQNNLVHHERKTIEGVEHDE